MLPESEGSFCTTTDGATLAFTVVGSGPPVLMIQGVGVIGRGWQPQIDGLSDRFTGITFDNRGIGGSTPGRDSLSIEVMARDALAVADAAGATRFHLVGHSMGGVIAQEVALRAPGRVRSLTLMCTFVRGRDGTALNARMLWLGLRTRLGTRGMRRLAFLEMVMPKSALAALDRAALADRLSTLFGHDLADSPPIVMPQLRALSRYDAADRLTSLGGIPTLVMGGAHDPIARPASGRALAAAIPGARHLEYPDASHGLPLQFPDRVNTELAAHWISHEP